MTWSISIWSTLTRDWHVNGASYRLLAKNVHQSVHLKPQQA